MFPKIPATSKKYIARRGDDVMSYAEAKVGLKMMRARGWLAKAVSGHGYSRRSKGSVTEGSVKGSVFSESGAACCMQKRAIWRARRPRYIEEIRALERRRPTEAADGLEWYRMREAFVA